MLTSGTKLGGGGSSFGIKEAFNTFVYIYNMTIFGTACHKARKVAVKTLSVGAFVT